MKISELSIRNMKSFGNNRQTLRFSTDKGQLILLTGENGSGKSSILESVEYVLYGTVKSNKKKKKATLSTLPNRINKNLETSIKFITNDKNNIKITRGISPDILALSVNGNEPDDKAGKAIINTKIQDYIGMDIDTFKSFISMSINDFKNFIELSTEDRQNLIDKLFNLEVINELNSVLKSVVAANKKSITRFEGEVDTIKSNIISIRQRIDNAKVKEEENFQSEIDEIKQSVSDNKESYLKAKNNLEKIRTRKKDLEKDLQVEQNEMYDINSKIKEEERSILLYNQSKCPTCSTDFKSTHFTSLLETLKEKKDKLIELKNTINDNINNLRARLSKGEEIEREVQKTFNDLHNFLSNAKSRIDQLESKKNSKQVSSSIDEFMLALKEFKQNYKEKNVDLEEYKNNEIYYRELTRLFGEDGVRKNIISGLIKPINQFIKQNLEVINLPFSVVLDESFTATIKTYNEEVDQDTLSTGENKLINVCIMLAYLNLIRTKKNINILFLDEVFSSVSVKNIDKLLLLLQTFAYKNNINVIVVHHAVLNPDRFDKVIQVKKEAFSNMSVYDVSQMSPTEINQIAMVE